MSITIKHQIKLIINNIKENIRQYTVIENDSNSVILLLGLAQIPSTVQWEITPIDSVGIPNELCK